MYSQIGQDLFVLKCLQGKRNGYFLEIGSHDAIHISNTYLLEKEYDWRGIMVEYDPRHVPSYKAHRKSSYCIQDATTIDFKKLLEPMPKNIDYLQIDLEEHNGSTIKTLANLHRQVMSEYKFAVVTFEHDHYREIYKTRESSRAIFSQHGYYLVFPNVSDFEDWYVHPDLVDMNYIKTFASDKELTYEEILEIL